MRFRRQLYLGESIKNRHRILFKLKIGAGMTDIYVISLAYGRNQLECMHCAMFKQRAIRQNVGLIVGLAKGYGQARDLMIEMIEDCLKATGTANVKDFLLKE